MVSECLKGETEVKQCNALKVKQYHRGNWKQYKSEWLKSKTI